MFIYVETSSKAVSFLEKFDYTPCATNGWFKDIGHCREIACGHLTDLYRWMVKTNTLDSTRVSLFDIYLPHRRKGSDRPGPTDQSFNRWAKFMVSISNDLLTKGGGRYCTKGLYGKYLGGPYEPTRFYKSKLPPEESAITITFPWRYKNNYPGVIRHFPVSLMGSAAVLSYLIQTVRIWWDSLNAPPLPREHWVAGGIRPSGCLDNALERLLGTFGLQLLPTWFHEYGEWDYWAFTSILLGIATRSVEVPTEALLTGHNSEDVGVNGYRTWLLAKEARYQSVREIVSWVKELGILSLLSPRRFK